METKWLLIVWFVASTSGSPSYTGDIYNVPFEDEASCKNALIAIHNKSRGKIDGVCTASKSSAPKMFTK